MATFRGSKCTTSTPKVATGSVGRFVAGLRSSQPRRVWRVECEPGEELQIDFMAGPMLPDPAKPDKRRRCWLLRAVLSHSRKGYTEAVWPGQRELPAHPGERFARF